MSDLSDLKRLTKEKEKEDMRKLQDTILDRLNI